MTVYSVVKYVPDPLKQECINVGLIAVAEGIAKCYFPTNLKRAAWFGGVEASYLRDVLLELRRACESANHSLEFAEDSYAMNEARLKKLSQEWQRVVIISDPKPSLQSPTETIEH